MNASEISNCLQFIPNFGGVLAANMLPIDEKSRNKFYVVNTDPSDKPGQHWTVFYNNKDNVF